MQVGAENRIKLFAMIVLALLGAFMLVRAFTSADNVTAAPSTPKPAPAGPVRSAAQVKRQAPNAQAQSLDPTIRLDLLAASEGIKYEGNGRNIFRAEAEAPPIKDDPKSDARSLPMHPGAPDTIPASRTRPSRAVRVTKSRSISSFSVLPIERVSAARFLSQEQQRFYRRRRRDREPQYRVMKIGVNSVEYPGRCLNNTRKPFLSRRAEKCFAALIRKKATYSSWCCLCCA